MPTKAKAKLRKGGNGKVIVKKARPTEDALKEFEAITESRYKLAKEIYEHQDNLTKEVIDRIRDRLRIAATGVVSVNGKPVKLEQQYVDFNIWFIACEIMSDLAICGIQVANFQFNPAICTECKSKILGVKEPRKRRR